MAVWQAQAQGLHGSLLSAKVSLVDLGMCDGRCGSLVSFGLLEGGEEEWLW